MTGRSAAVGDSAASPVESIVALTCDFITIPSRAGEDQCDPMIDRATRWLDEHGVSVTVLTLDSGRPVAVVGEVVGVAPGPTYCLNACLDTAPFGQLASWDRPPTEPRVAGGWLYGRGAADSKVAVAIFSHMAAEFQRRREELKGRLLVLFDADEHTGGFAGVKAFLQQYPKPDGVMVGYPGNYGIVVGARGFYRATVSVHGVGGHSGGRKVGSENAIEKATRLVQALSTATLPGPASEMFPLAPSLTVTGIAGGASFSMVPDHCEVNVDMRLTPGFDAEAARALLRATVDGVDALPSAGAATAIADAESWPAYRLSERVPVVDAMLTAARMHHNPRLTTVVCGPSNVGNYFAANGVDATCGFGVTYQNLHAPNECLKLDTIEMTHRVYTTAINRLLARVPIST